MKRREFLKGLAVGGAAVAAGACHRDVAPAGTVRVSNDVPVLDDYDVCVVGAGPGGVGAAIAAARAGKRTILVEHYGYPGGVGTNCNTPTFFFDPYKGVQYLRGIADEFVRRLAKRGAAWFLTHDERYQPDYSRPVGDLPILVCGGVASSNLLRTLLKKRCSQRLSFGEPAYSSDNAVGVALLGADRGQI